MLNRRILRFTIAVIAVNLWCIRCLAGIAARGEGDRIFADSAQDRHLIFHHHFDAGVICRVGRDRVRTYDDYDHLTSTADNYILGEYSRFLALRVAHGVGLKRNCEAGITYGADIYYQPHDVRAFVPLMLHVLNNTRLTKKLALLFVERAGYAFYLRSKNTDVFLKYPGVEGGFTSETLAGLSIKTSKRNYLQILLGYRFQHIYSKAVFYPDQTLIQQGGVYAMLLAKITEISNGLYHFIYLSVGVPF